ncbi:MAG TPA: hypothetical protein PKG95_00940 [Anaerolineaceae bacterium]|nr:hypothetical protein [Anaerolineaceae bacterium]
MRAIRASELGAYRFCRRAWWYQLQGVPSDNQGDLTIGSSYHQHHSRRTFSAGLMRAGGLLLLLAGLAVLVIWLTDQVLR